MHIRAGIFSRSAVTGVLAAIITVIIVLVAALIAGIAYYVTLPPTPPTPTATPTPTPTPALVEVEPNHSGYIYPIMKWYRVVGVVVNNGGVSVRISPSFFL